MSHTIENTLIDAAVYEIDAVMNGGDNLSEIAPFMDDSMDEMRAIIRNLLVTVGQSGVQLKPA